MTTEFFDNVFKHIDEMIVPKLKDGTYMKENGGRGIYYENGNYNEEKIETIRKNEMIESDASLRASRTVEGSNIDINGKYITLIIPIKNRVERMKIQMRNLVSVMDMERIEIIIVEDEYKPLDETKYDEHNIKIEEMNDLSDDMRNVRYYRVRSGAEWSRARLLNYGIAKTRTVLFMACDVDFIFSENFCERMEKYCRMVNFYKYSLGVTVYETHDSYWDDEHTNILRYAYEPYGACYIYLTEGVKYVGGFDTEIVNHGCEDIEMRNRLYANGCETIYSQVIYPELYVLHYSHDNGTRGKGHTYEEYKDIIEKSEKRKIFKWELETIKTYNDE